MCPIAYSPFFFSCRNIGALQRHSGKDPIFLSIVSIYRTPLADFPEQATGFIALLQCFHGHGTQYLTVQSTGPPPWTTDGFSERGKEF